VSANAAGANRKATAENLGGAVTCSSVVIGKYRGNRCFHPRPRALSIAYPARVSHSLDAPWLDLWPAIAFSPLANTSSIGGGAQNRWRAKSLRHRRAIL